MWIRSVRRAITAPIGITLAAVGLLYGFTWFLYTEMGWSKGHRVEDQMDGRYFLRGGPTIDWLALEKTVDMEKFQRRASEFANASRGLLASQVEVARSHGLCLESVNLRAPKELGYNLEVYLGYAYYLHLYGCLSSTESFEGTHPFYFFSMEHKVMKTSDIDPDTIWVFEDVPAEHPLKVIERTDAKLAEERKCSLVDKPNNLARQFRAPSFGLIWPPFHAFYKTQAFNKLDRPLALVCGKHSTEWAHEPINTFAAPDTLKPIVDTLLQSGYFIIYNRPAVIYPGDSAQEVVFSEDFNFLRSTYSWNDVFLFQDLRKKVLVQAKVPYSTDVDNVLLLSVYASASIFVVTQGGNGVVASLFPGEIFVLHRLGSEQLRQNPLPDGNDYVYSRWSQHGGARLHVFETPEELVANLRSHLQANAFAANHTMNDHHSTII